MDVIEERFDVAGNKFIKYVRALRTASELGVTIFCLDFCTKT